MEQTDEQTLKKIDQRKNKQNFSKTFQDFLPQTSQIKRICLVVLAGHRGCDRCTSPDQPELFKISQLSPYPSNHVFEQKDASKVPALFFSLAINFDFTSFDYVDQESLLGHFSRTKRSAGFPPILPVLCSSKRMPAKYRYLLSF